MNDLPLRFLHDLRLGGVALLLCLTTAMRAADLWIEAEAFTNRGGWQVDQQFMDCMGSPYLLAHGLGSPVADAVTNITIPERNTYFIYVRTYNWTSPWSTKEGPGAFRLAVGGKTLSTTLGTTGNRWEWQRAGSISLPKGERTLRLIDLTGFDGRVDAIFISTVDTPPPSQDAELAAFRHKAMGIDRAEQATLSFDLVVAGGGIAGICTAVTAARLGLRVALITDRPVLGGNNSSEVRVHLGGRLGQGPYPALGGLLREFGPSHEGNAQPAANYEDDRKLDIVTSEPLISLFLDTRIVGVRMNGNQIAAVMGQDVLSGEQRWFASPVFADCTGDGAVGYMAGADYRMGRESHDEFGESTAPDVADMLTMGASVQWYSTPTKRAVRFPEFDYGLPFNELTCEKVMRGDWDWETGMTWHQIDDFEKIRDYGLMVVYSNWSFLKNHYTGKADYSRRRLEWVAYVAGKRESRRLLGDYILSEEDITKEVHHEDASFTTTWSIDLHYPNPLNLSHFPAQAFRADTHQKVIKPYAVPYRCLYSRNIDNLFMAGRCISVTHVALGTVRVMRTTAQMGEVVGMAASICKKRGIKPRDIYRLHLPELKELMRKGIGGEGWQDNQDYNLGS